MIEVQKTEPNHVLQMKAIEKISSSDLEHIEPVLEKYLAEQAEPRLLVIIEQFKGWNDAKAFLQDLKLDTKLAKEFSKIAVLGEQDWEKWITRFLSPAASSEIKYFKHSEISSAHSWLNEKVNN